MADNKKLFGRRVKDLREGKGWTQEYLAERMDISTNYLSSIERGNENPTFDMLIKVSEALEVEMEELFNFGHEASLEELRGNILKLVQGLDDEKLRLVYKIVWAVVR